MSAVDGAPWHDSANDEEDFRGFCRTRAGHIVGMDAGLIAIVKPDDSQELIEGALRCWKRHGDRLERLFEMTANKSPIQSMQFSQDGDLYLLRQGHRGVIRLELDKLAAHFHSCGLALPEESSGHRQLESAPVSENTRIK